MRKFIRSPKNGMKININLYEGDNLAHYHLGGIGEKTLHKKRQIDGDE